jgi:hypothetical protein
MRAIKNLFFGTEPLTDQEILVSGVILGFIGLVLFIPLSELFLSFLSKFI